MARGTHDSSNVNSWTVIKLILEAANPQVAIKHAIQVTSPKTLTMFQEEISVLDESKLMAAFLGKASVSLAAGALPLLKDLLYRVLIVCLPNLLSDAKNLVETLALSDVTTILRGDHPLPTNHSLSAGKALINLVDSLDTQDVLLMFISGGGSAMVEVTKDGISLTDVQQMNRVLLKSGASIHEINALRKHVSAIKGGQLAARCRGRIEALLLSDVPNDDPSIIASGLTAPDPSTFRHCQAIIKKYHLEERFDFPPAILRFIEKNVDKKDHETPKNIENAHNHVLLSSATVMQQLEKEMEKNGYQPLSGHVNLDRPVEQVAQDIINLIDTIRKSSTTNSVITLGNGEPQVIVKGSGRGGRCSELALHVLREIATKPTILEEFKDVTLIFLASDGKDGNTDAAGISMTKYGIERVMKTMPSHQLVNTIEQFLQTSDSFTFFEKYWNDSVVRLAITTTNVRDFFVGMFKKCFKARKA